MYKSHYLLEGNFINLFLLQGNKIKEGQMCLALAKSLPNIVSLSKSM